MSLYKEYLEEKTNQSIIETSYGFITYGFPDARTCWIQDLYIHPSRRKSHVATELADQVLVIAKERGCTELLGSVIPSNKNSTDSLKVLLAYGMSLKSATNDFILFSRSV